MLRLAAVFCRHMVADKPKLSPTNTRALTRMKQTLRKHNASFAEEMQAFRCPSGHARMLLSGPSQVTPI
jgi:hypothetical protein